MMKFLTALLAGLLLAGGNVWAQLPDIDWETATVSDVQRVDVNARDDSGNTPLHWAAIKGNSKVALYLLNNGADSNARNTLGSTPLHWTVHNNKIDIALLLLANGADVNVRDNNDKTPLHLAVREDKDEFIQLLFAARDDDDFIPLHWATHNGNIAIAPLLLTPLLLANGDGVSDWKTATVLDVQGVDVNARDDLENTPLHRAAYWGNGKIAKYFLDNGANINARNAHGYTPLHAAVDGGNGEIAQLLLDKNANINARGAFGEQPIHIAAKVSDEFMISLLVHSGADINSGDENSKTPLMYAASSGRSNNVITFLKNGANALARDANGKTVLDWAETEDSELKGTEGYWLLRETVIDARNSSVTSISPNPNASGSEAVFENNWRSIVVIKTSDGQGSGVIIRPNIVATNCHVVDDGGRIAVYKANNRQAKTDITHNASIYRSDPSRDICLLNVSGLWGIPSQLRTTDSVRVGEDVYAIGAPDGLEYSLSAGVVSQLRAGNRIQTDVAIAPGSSGGGLFDAKGNLIGITTSRLTESDGISFAIPSDWILELMN